MKTQLLCTFTKRNHFNETIDVIIACKEIVFNKIYVFSNENDHHQLICTYNVDQDEKIDFNSVDNTISLHRKKLSNTLYTINALNELIKTINNGVLDTRYQVPWELYKNMILITNKDGLQRIPTRILKIINL